MAFTLTYKGLLDDPDFRRYEVGLPYVKRPATSAARGRGEMDPSRGARMLDRDAPAFRGHAFSCVEKAGALAPLAHAFQDVVLPREYCCGGPGAAPGDAVRRHDDGRDDGHDNRHDAGFVHEEAEPEVPRFLDAAPHVEDAVLKKERIASTRIMDRGSPGGMPLFEWCVE